MRAHAHALAVLFALLVGCGEHGCCGDNETPDATAVDALELDACICPPHWPTCPAGCTPLDASSP